MRAREPNALMPAEEDPAIHRMLSDLPTPEPRRNLADRVLSHVRRPHPFWVRRIEAGVGEMVESGRIWLVIGGLAVGSLLPVALAVGGVFFFAPTLAKAFDVAVAEWLPAAWTYVRLEAMSLVETGHTWVGGFALEPHTWLVVTGGMLAVLTGCVWGLRRTMTPRAARR